MDPSRRWSRRSPRVAGLGAVLVLAASGLSAQEPPDADALMDHLDQLYRAESSRAVMTMTVVKERGTRELTLESWSRGEEEALIVIREPPREAGTATLRTEEGLWNYAPRADRLIRIPTGLLSDDWMGSHFTNDDLVRETSFDEDYETVVEWGEEDGRRVLVATLTPRPDAPVVYTRIVYVLTADDWIPLRADYYDGEERVRSMTFDRVETVSGRRIPMRMVLQPADPPDERTEMVYTSLEFDVDVDPELFTRRGLRRVARGTTGGDASPDAPR